jgi:PAS domain S-box-containing protein
VRVSASRHGICRGRLDEVAAVLDSVLDSIITMDADGIVIEFSAAAERTFGYSKAEAIGRALADLIIPPRLRDAHRSGLARYLATGEGPLIGKLIEAHQAGRWVRVHC